MPSHLVENQKITNENLSITFLCDVANGGTNRQTNKWQWKHNLLCGGNECYISFKTEFPGICFVGKIINYWPRASTQFLKAFFFKVVWVHVILPINAPIKGFFQYDYSYKLMQISSSRNPLNTTSIIKYNYS